MPPDGDAVPGGCVGGGSAVRVFTPAAARGWLARSVVGFGGKERTARGQLSQRCTWASWACYHIVTSGSETQARQARLGWVLVGWEWMDRGWCWLPPSACVTSRRRCLPLPLPLAKQQQAQQQRLQGLEKE